MKTQMHTTHHRLIALAMAIAMALTLYEKGLLGYKEVDSASASANSRTCSKTVSYAFKDGKSYKLTVTGSAYVDGQWDTVTKNFTASF